MNTRSIVVITIAILAAGVALSFVYRQGNGAADLGNDTVDQQVDDTGSAAAAIPVETVAYKAGSASEKSSILVAKGKDVIRKNVASGVPATVTSLGLTGTLVDAAYDTATGTLAYVETVGTTDTAYLVPKKGSAVKLIDASHPETDEENVAQNKYVGSVAFSPDAGFVIVSTGGWEACEDVVFSVSTKKEAYRTECGVTYWSPDALTIMDAEATGMTTGNRLAFSSGSRFTLKDVDWNAAKGDVSLVYDKDAGELSRGFWLGLFRTNDEVLLLTDTGDTATTYLMAYTVSTNTIRKVAELPVEVPGGLSVTGDTAVVTSGDTAYTVGLKDSTLAKVGWNVSFDANDGTGLYRATDGTFILSDVKCTDEGACRDAALYGFDVAAKTFWTIPLGDSEMFIGVGG